MMKVETQMKLKVGGAVALVILFMALFSPGLRYTAEFDVFVPTDYGKEYEYSNPESQLTFRHTTYSLVHRDGTMTVGPYSNAYGWTQFKEYRGHHITFKASYSSLDDENWYKRSIYDITIQDDEDLGSYPKGFHDGDYYHAEPRWWQD